eukprot:TRINITY_DN1383_c0_g1_i4.p1 TRINITY_DN1383_c0_g1~~TRINITY_DN1383_c0_g1_i4.p1  ORF type:complete len:281 (-),score=48.77 TRINITY_DN1383_c0_g1_i4:1100-1942(-)
MFILEGKGVSLQFVNFWWFVLRNFIQVSMEDTEQHSKKEEEVGDMMVEQQVDIDEDKVDEMQGDETSPIVQEQEEGDTLNDEQEEQEADMEHDQHEADTEIQNGLPSKKQKTEDGEGEPVQLGYKTFHSGSECYQYFNHVLNGVPKQLFLNEYEHKALQDLLYKGHHNVESKVGDGIKGFKVLQNARFKQMCFHIVQNDESVVDFSYIKCIQGLFPEFDINNFILHDRGGRCSPSRGRGRGRGRRGRNDGPQSFQNRGRGRGRGGRNGEQRQGGRRGRGD